MFIVAVPYLGWLATGLTPRTPDFAFDVVHLGFVVEKVAQGQSFPRVLRYSLAIDHFTNIPH
jgi:hypothetical protein